MVPGVPGAAGAAVGQTVDVAGRGPVTTRLLCLVVRTARETPQRSPSPPATVTTVVQVRGLPPPLSDDVVARHLGLPGLLQEVRGGQSGDEIFQENSHSLSLCRILCLSQLLPGWS